jgi:hypothetical protein
MPRDFPVTGCQLRHASPVQQKKMMYKRVTGDAHGEQFTGISHHIEQ